MKINSAYRDLLRTLNDEGVRFLVAGGYAWMAHSEPPYTTEIDVWSDPTPDNAAALLRALARFGAPTAQVTVSDFTKPEVFYQIGVEPVRVDVMTSVPGLQFADAWNNRMDVDFEGIPAPVISREDLLRAKVASARQRK